MFDATLPSETSPPDGAAFLAFADADGDTRLTDLYQKTPLRVLFPDRLAGDPPTAALVTTSGGLVGGDRLDVQCHVDKGAKAFVVNQAAEKVYRSAGADVSIDVRLGVEAGGWLEYLPQETILFNGARLRRRTRIDHAAGGQFLAGEILVFGRRAHGEVLAHGMVHEIWEVRRDGVLAWTDVLHLDGDIAAVLKDPHAFRGAGAMATAVYSGSDLDDALETAREVLGACEANAMMAATIVNDLLIVRWLATDPFELRGAFGEFWAQFRHQIAGLPAQLPRLWHV